MGRAGFLHCMRVMVFLLMGTMAWAGAGTPSDQDTDGDGIPNIDERALVVDVPAGPSVQNIYETSSELIVQAHQDIVIEATGIIDAGNGITSTPSGRPDINPIFPRVLPNAPFLALVGRIDDGEFFLIGNAAVLSVTEPGTLFLTVNEVVGQYSNNSGSYTARIGEDIGTDPGRADTDGDTVNDGVDVFPLDRSEWLDTDQDGIGNNADLDDDGDTISDIEEIYGTFTVPAGPTDPITLYPTGIELAPNDVVQLSATGTILADGILSITSTADGRPDIDTSTVTTVDNSQPYLALLGRFGTQGPWRFVGSSGQVKLQEIVNGDFETGNLEGWQVASGTAFDNQPTLGPNRGQDTQQGDYWIGTFENYQGEPGQTPGDIQGNGPQGVLVSNTFTLYGDGLSFLLGGGDFPWPSSDSIAANLVDGTNVLRTATGDDSTDMRLVTFDVRNLRYRDVELRLYDLNSGQFGFINFDNMYQSNLSGMPVAPGNVRAELVLAVNDIVNNFGMNTGDLTVTVGDGITSNPLLKDTDGDNFDDDEELFWGTDPNDPNEFPIPEIVLLPNPLDFDEVDVDTLSQKTFRVRNDGVANLVIEDVTFAAGSNPAFTLPVQPTLPLVLGTGTQTFIPVNFNPSLPGPATGTLEFVSNDPDTMTAALALSATGVAPEIAAGTTSLDFGAARVGTAVTDTIQLTNTGNKVLTLSSVDILPALSDFFLPAPPAPDTQVAAGSILDITVAYLPAAPVQQAATLRILSDALNQPSLDIALSGQGLQPEIEVMPVAINFGSTAIGNTLEETVVVRNSGNMDLTLTALSLGGDSEFELTAAPALPDILAPSGERVLGLSFSPQAAGTFTGTLTISSDDDDEPVVEVGLNGAVPTPTPTITPTPTETPVPTSTPTATPTETPTVTPTFTAMPSTTPTVPSPTPTATATAIATTTATPSQPTGTPTSTPTSPPTSTPSPTPTVVVDPDLDGNGTVDDGDLLLFLEGIDLNNDGVTNYRDLFLMQSAWEGQ